jgi:phosphate transport system substrate-binding protein
MTRLSLLLSSATLALATTAGAQSVDPNLPEYQPVSGVSGNLVSIGSDTLNNLMTLWSEGFRSHYPNVAVQIQGAGSGTAPARADRRHRPVRPDVAPDARFRDRGIRGPLRLRADPDPRRHRRFGRVRAPRQPDRVPVVAAGRCHLLVDSRRRHRRGDHHLGSARPEGEWANRPIAMYGRNSASGTFGYFREVALFGGDFSPEVREQPGSSTVIQGVAADINGIGYSGIGYATADVRAVPLSSETGGECFEATAEDASAGDYPIARFLYVYMNVDPNAQLEPLRAEFVRYVYSRQGQEDVVRAGFFPLVKAIADQDLANFGLTATN